MLGSGQGEEDGVWPHPPLQLIAEPGGGVMDFPVVQGCFPLSAATGLLWWQNLYAGHVTPSGKICLLRVQTEGRGGEPMSVVHCTQDWFGL